MCVNFEYKTLMLGNNIPYLTKRARLFIKPKEIIIVSVYVCIFFHMLLFYGLWSKYVRCKLMFFRIYSFLSFCVVWKKQIFKIIKLIFKMVKWMLSFLLIFFSYFCKCNCWNKFCRMDLYKIKISKTWKEARNILEIINLKEWIVYRQWPVINSTLHLDQS